jgi:elongation factor P--(R)-beta-lysine ligase
VTGRSNTKNLSGETSLGESSVGLLTQRHKARVALREFFEARSYLEVDTPTLVECPGLDAHVHSLGKVERPGKASFLITSPELHMKRLIAAGLPRIYQVAHCYRAEELGAWHQPEFLMLEWYRTGGCFDDLILETEELVRTITLALRTDGKLVRGDAGIESDVTGPFLRMQVADAFREFAGIEDVSGLASDDPLEFFQLLVDRVEPALARLGRPVCLTHYPLSQAGLARPSAEFPGFAERFELYAAGIELCNGFAELTDAAEQRRRFEIEVTRRMAAREPVYPIDEAFLGALERGMPDTVGNALGLDRLIALALGASGIHDVLPFPDPV